MATETLTFTAEELDKVNRLTRELFPSRHLSFFGNESNSDLYEYALRQHTIVSILAEMQRRQEPTQESEVEA